MKLSLAMLGLCGLLVVFGCKEQDRSARNAAATGEPQIMFFNIISGAEEDPHSVTMALQLAGHALDAGREVVLFFNVRGVGVPTTALADDLAFHAAPVKELLHDLMQRGAEVHVCPHCMAALDVKEADLVPGAIVTDREKLFARLGPETNVFTY
jgi:predicted peroxiredoxin